MLIGLQKAVINSELQNTVKSRKKKNQVRNDGSMFSVQAAYFAELFNSATRVTAISMSREISSIFAGGLAPIIASSLLLWSNGNYAAVAWYMVALSVITVVALCYGPETRGCSLDDH